MTVTRVDIIDRSVEKAHVWINDLAEELGSEDRTARLPGVARVPASTSRPPVGRRDRRARGAVAGLHPRRLLRGLESKSHARPCPRPRELPCQDCERGGPCWGDRGIDGGHRGKPGSRLPHLGRRGRERGTPPPPAPPRAAVPGCDAKRRVGRMNGLGCPSRTTAQHPASGGPIPVTGRSSGGTRCRHTSGRGRKEWSHVSRSGADCGRRDSAAQPEQSTRLCSSESSKEPGMPSPLERPSGSPSGWVRRRAD